MMRLDRFVVDVYGVVHELFPYAFMGQEMAWSWPPGHVDAQSRRISVTMSHGVPTCLVCIREYERTPADIKAKMGRLREKFMR